MQCQASFTCRLRATQALVVVSVMRAILPQIKQCMLDAMSKHTPLYDLPFPVGANYLAFVQGLQRLLVSFKASEVMPGII